MAPKLTMGPAWARAGQPVVTEPRPRCPRTNKPCYVTADAAEAEAERILQRDRGDRGTLRAYRCKSCHKWHVGNVEVHQHRPMRRRGI